MEVEGRFKFRASKTIFLYKAGKNRRTPGGGWSYCVKIGSNGEVFWVDSHSVILNETCQSKMEHLFLNFSPF